MSDYNFIKWWSDQNQTIGEVTAQAAWDHQQEKIDELNRRIKLAKRLENANLPGFITDALDGVTMMNVKFFGDTTIYDYLEALEKEHE